MPTHAEQRIVPYTPKQIFDLVADVERYPQFLPWCLACRIRRRPAPDVFVADLMIGFKVFREKFTSEVTLHRPDRIDVVYRRWARSATSPITGDSRPTNAAAASSTSTSTSSSARETLQTLIGRLFNEAVQRMVNAFEKRAGQLYGAGAGAPCTSAANAEIAASGEPPRQ